ncbi:MAG: GPW/gp25 family protein [Candidatus Angelobacter sp.]|nr:GPW/gp25 family protein [Candidatus Limnocylindrales bacterium]
MAEYLDFPFDFDGSGRAARTDPDDHVRDMIYQLLFTNPGERVNLPDFGCGLLQMVFRPNSEALAAATQLLVQGALQQWLGDVIAVQKLSVNNIEERLEINLVYLRRDTGQQVQVQFVSPKGGQ